MPVNAGFTWRARRAALFVGHGAGPSSFILSMNVVWLCLRFAGPPITITLSWVRQMGCHTEITARKLT